LPPKELIEQLERLRDRLAAGKGVSKTFQKDLRRVRESCTVDEEPPRKAEDAELCIIEARSRRRRYELIHRWNNAVGRIAGPLIDPATSHPEYLLDQYMRGISAAFAWEDGARYTLRDRLRACGVRVSEHATSASLTALAETLTTATLHIAEKRLTAWLDLVRKHLADGASQPQASGLWRALLNALDAVSGSARLPRLSLSRRVRFTNPFTDKAMRPARMQTSQALTGGSTGRTGRPDFAAVFKSVRNSLSAAVPTWTFSMSAFCVIQDHPVHIP
jgi:hypothetical protein